MDVTYSIDIENMKKLIAQCPQVFADEALQLLREVVTVLEGKVVEHTPVGVGGEAGLRGSISSDAYIRAREIVGTVGTPLAYGEVVERGRPASQAMPPVEALIPWVRAKLDVPEKEVRSVAFLVARSIGKKGFKGADMFAKGFNETEPWIMTQLRGLPARVEARLVE